MKDKQLQTREVTQLSVIILFVAVLLISNVVATKLIGIPGTDIVVDGGVFLFPLAYILGDIMTEVYGFRRTRLTILMGFFALFLLSLTIFIVQIAPPAQYWENQAAFETVLGIVPRIVVGSLVAYIVGELLNSYIMARMKVASNGRHFWARALGSTAVSALIDTIIFSMIAFYGIIPFSSLIWFVLTGYFIKLSVETLMLPLTIKVVNAVKKIEGQEHFDKDLSVKTIFRG